jgi:hypothetical protein
MNEFGKSVEIKSSNPEKFQLFKSRNLAILKKWAL